MMRFIVIPQMKPLIPVTIILASVFTSCNNLGGKTKSPDFYTADREADLYRIPLIEPFQLYNTGFIDEPWFMDLTDSLPGLLYDQLAIDAVWVDPQDSLIGLYAESIYLPGEMTSAWFLFDVPGKTSRYFKSAKEFNNAAGQEATFDSCSKVYKTFSESGKLPWK